MTRLLKRRPRRPGLYWLTAGFLVLATPASTASPDEEREPRFDDEAVSPVPEGDSVVRPGLAAELAAREEQLALAQAELEETKKDLLLARQQLEQQLAELKRLTELAARDDGKDEDETQKEEALKLRRLITTVEKMDPEAAAPYLDNFPTATAAAILHQMKVRKAAAIIADMNASKAAALSRYYLKNGQLPPDTDSK